MSGVMHTVKHPCAVMLNKSPLITPLDHAISGPGLATV